MITGHDKKVGCFITLQFLLSGLYVVGSFVSAAHVYADSATGGITEAEKSEAKFLWEGMINARSKLRSGILRIKVEKQIVESTFRKSPPVEEYEIIFDRDADSYSFLHKYKSHAEGREKELRDCFRHVIKNTEEKLLNTGSAVVARLQPNESFRKSGDTFDFYSVGLHSRSFGAYFDSILALKNFIDNPKNELISFFRVSDSVYFYEFDAPYKDADCRQRTKYWLDVAKDFSPVRTRHSVINGITGTGSDQSETGWKQNFEVTWHSFGPSTDIVWLPKESILTVHNGNSDFIEKITYDWSSVNETINSETFTVETMKVAEGNFLVDVRLGVPIVRGRFYDGSVALTGEAALMAVAEEAKKLTAQRFRVRLLVHGISIIIILAVFYFLYKRGRKDRNSNQKEK